MESLRGKSSVPDAYLGGVAGYRCSVVANRREAVNGCQWLVHRHPYDGITPQTLKTAPSLAAHYTYCMYMFGFVDRKPNKIRA